MRTKLKNVLSGKVVDKTFNAGIKVETANVDKRDMQYLYKDGADFVFMDGDTYDQIHVPGRDGRRRRQLPAREPGGRSSPCTTATPLYVELPASVELVITYTEPGLQGDRSTGGTKPATLETGAEIQVPLFLEHRRQGQGRHPRRPLPRPRQRLTAWPPAPRPASAPSTSSSRPSSAGVDAARRCSRERRRRAGDRGAADRVHRRARRGRRRAPRPASTSCIADLRQGWTLDRMPAVDRAILRLGAYELLCADDVPDAGRDRRGRRAGQGRSPPTTRPRFVNGLLARLAEVKPTLA